MFWNVDPERTGLVSMEHFMPVWEGVERAGMQQVKGEGSALSACPHSLCPLTHPSRIPTTQTCVQVWQNQMSLLLYKDEVARLPSGKKKLILKPMSKFIIDENMTAAIFCKYGFDKDGLMPYAVFNQVGVVERGKSSCVHAIWCRLSAFAGTVVAVSQHLFTSSKQLDPVVPLTVLSLTVHQPRVCSPPKPPPPFTTCHRLHPLFPLPSLSLTGHQQQVCPPAQSPRLSHTLPLSYPLPPLTAFIQHPR